MFLDLWISMFFWFLDLFDFWIYRFHDFSIHWFIDFLLFWSHWFMDFWISGLAYQRQRQPPCPQVGPAVSCGTLHTAKNAVPFFNAMPNYTNKRWSYKSCKCEVPLRTHLTLGEVSRCLQPGLQAPLLHWFIEFLNSGITDFYYVLITHTLRQREPQRRQQQQHQ